ncbi:hypothetical protein DFR50_14155 [Roseiarcus fermentans]|uniref:Uncharacterized protein n=1 Tax=Roseiarcus fermentans TaxID=1473586 RepID=A0A366ENU9_9HYPH|nr:hypothetical protein [Roseiarcus fermentans]RBP04083.1 hypothetical protein DFR50_14155 [Roseiarcus fermentans]
MTLAAETWAGHQDSVHATERADAASAGTTFLLPAAGRIVTGVGLAAGQFRQAPRHHGAAARRILLGRQILKIVARLRSPD